MNGKDLLTGMSFVSAKFIAEAENEYMERKGQGLTVRGTVKRTLLIAAIITAMVLMMGSAAAMLYLQDLEIGEIEQPRYYDEEGQHIQPTEVTKAVISLRGYQDTPNYLATKEWYAFEQNYDPNDEILHAYEDFSLDNYEVYQNIYGCYSPEMADKVDEIAQKYGLKLLSQETVVQRWQTDIMFDAMGIDGVCHDEKCASVSDGAGYFYAEGNFKYEFEFLLPQENDSWSHEVWANLLYTKKDYFDPDYSIVDTELYEQWQYTTSDGVDVLIAKSYGGAMIFAEQEDACLTVMLNTNMMLDEPETPSNRDLELMAEAIDFSIEPSAPENMEEVRKLLEESDAARQAQTEAAIRFSGYGEYLYSRYPEGNHSVYFALADINGDAVEDLLLGDENGNFFLGLTLRDGTVEELYNAENFWLCEDGTLVNCWKHSFRTEYYFMRLEGAESVVLEWQSHDSREDIWKDGEDKPITAEEAQAVRDKYVRTEVNVAPIMEYPMDAQGTTLEEYILANTVQTTAEERMALYREYIKRDQESAYVPSTHYLLMDVNGDGEEELLLSDDGESIANVITVVNGKIKKLFMWTNLYLCENEIWEYYGSGGREEYHDYFTIDKEGNHLVDSLYYSIADSSWHRSADGDYYLEQTISEEEYHDILSSYARVKLEMKPIGEFPID